MPRDSHFFEEAMTLCNDSDGNVARLADAIYRVMLKESQHRKLAPQGPFQHSLFYSRRNPFVAVGATGNQIGCEHSMAEDA